MKRVSFMRILDQPPPPHALLPLRSLLQPAKETPRRNLSTSQMPQFDKTPYPQSLP